MPATEFLSFDSSFNKPTSDLELISDTILQEGLDNKVFPGAILYIIKDEKLIYRSVKGYRNISPQKLPMTEDTIFDLASLTKPLATTLTALKIFEEEKISLNTPISYFLEKKPVNKNISKHLDKNIHKTSTINKQNRFDKITLFHLLTHTSGLPPVPDIYKHFDNPKIIDSTQARKLLLRVMPIEEPAKEVLYSCTGFLYLGYILEKITGARLGSLFDKLIVEKAKIKNLFFLPTKNKTEEFGVAQYPFKNHTQGKIQKESEGEHLKYACTEFCKWRKRWICGEVHDENSYCFGGDGGNAGLFGTADAITKLLTIFTNGGSIGNENILDEESISLMTHRAVSIDGLNRSVGFMMQGETAPCGPLYSEDSYGHTGFTGTSVWIEPKLNFKVILLTNRVHYGREETAEKIKEFRIKLHTAIYKAFA